MEPLLLPSNQPAARFYEGGARISSFRNEHPSPPHTPEDWIGSTTSVRGNAPTGMTRLADGELLTDAIERDPLSWLGAAHVQHFGVDTMLLVKLLDAGQRLPVHAHPDGDFAEKHVSTAHGKAEAWFILSAGVVHLGLIRDVPLSELRALVGAQDSATLLSLMHEIQVSAGDSIFVPHGMLHAIGAGILLAEVQEPEDLSILLEWTGFDLDGERDGHLGLGFDLALTAVESHGRSISEVEEFVLRNSPEGSVLPESADPFFRLDRVTSSRDFPSGFAIVIVIGGSAKLISAAGSSMELPAGSTVLIPHAAGSFHIDGDALVARPPRCE